jgi:hypothetical protein
MVGLTVLESVTSLAIEGALPSELLPVPLAGVSVRDLRRS